MSVISVAEDDIFAGCLMSDSSRFDNHLNENRQVRIFLSFVYFLRYVERTYGIG